MAENSVGLRSVTIKRDRFATPTCARLNLERRVLRS